MKRVLIFANLTAGRGKAGRIARRLEKHLHAVGYDVITLTDPAPKIDRSLLTVSAVGAIVIGGDGTLRAVADRLLECGNPAPLLVIPFGTANLMGRHLGIRWNEQTIEREVAAVLAAGKTVQLDAARANKKLFLLMAGVGFDAHVVHELQRIRRGPIHYASYALPAALAIANYRYPPIRVTVDDNITLTPGPAVAFVGNVKEYGTGFPILPHARPDDGLLDLCILPCRSPLELIKLFLMAATDSHLESEGAVYRKCKTVRIESETSQSIPVQIDGDEAGFTPIEISLLGDRLRFMVQ